MGINRQLEASLDGLDDDYTNERDIARQQQDVLKMVMEHSETVLIVLYVFLGLAILKIITTSMLIHGTKNDRRGLLIPFCIQETINTLAIFIFVCVMFHFLGSNKIT